MSTLAPSPEITDTGSDNTVSHWFCCDEDTALCGADIGGDDVNPDCDPDCVVCNDLFDAPCATTCRRAA